MGVGVQAVGGGGRGAHAVGGGVRGLTRWVVGSGGSCSGPHFSGRITICRGVCFASTRTTPTPHPWPQRLSRF